jgi:hypothetical protein
MIQKMIVDYLTWIGDTSNPEGFDRQVKELLCKGWQPFGGQQVIGEDTRQVMVIEEYVDVPNETSRLSRR